MRIRTWLFAAAVALPASLHAQAPTVSYTVTGSSGDWLLDFNVANGFASPSDQYLYLFGVFLPSGHDDNAGAPGGFTSWPATAFSLQSYGGTSTLYNDLWRVALGSDGNGIAENGIAAGSSLAGFTAHSTEADMPTSVQWFAFTYGTQAYGGSDYLNSANNPGFEGVATMAVTSTPEPASLALMATGFVGLGGVSVTRRRRTLASTT